MNDELVTPDPNAAAPVVEAAPELDAPLSIAEHAAQYDPNRDKTKDPTPDEPLAPLAANATAEQKAAHHSEQQRREKQTGKFADGKKRHRAQSQQATAVDSPRIQELTRKLREAEAKLAAPRVPPQQGYIPPPQQAAPAAQAPPQTSAQRWMGDPKNDPEPAEADFGGDPMKYLSARFQWEARGVNRYERHEAAQQHQQIERATSWAQRVEKAIANPKYPDYAQVAFGPTTIPAGSPMDQFIDGDDNGAEVLYHLQSNPAERDAVLRLPVVQQMKHLSLLSQRYDTASPSAAAAGVTGSAPRSNIRFIAPRPPNPVRTEAQRAEKTAAPLDGTLSIRNHAKQFQRR